MARASRGTPSAAACRVLLCEKDDLAQGTSSRSGKLVHGGLRYLEYYEFRLVREALIEREVLLEAAPHIIWPMRFVLPHSPEQRPAWLIRLGLFLYDHLGGRKRLPGDPHARPREAPEGRPCARHFTRGFEYSDCWVDDARLVVLNALDAARAWRRILHTHAVRLGPARRTAFGGRARRSATGARSNGRRQGAWSTPPVHGSRTCSTACAGVNTDNRVRLVKGSHIIMRKFWDGTAGLSSAEHRQAGDLRQSLRGGSRADRHHRHSLSRARADEVAHRR